MADEIEPCRIWKTDANFVAADNLSVTLDSCRAGGKYVITNAASAQVKNLNSKQLVKLTNWLVDQRHMGNDCPLVDGEAIENALSRATPTVSECRDKLLLWLYRYTDQLGQQFYLGSGGGRGGAVGKEDNERDEFVLACTSSLTNKELIMLVEFARVAGLVDCDPPRRTEPTLVSLSFSGYEKVSELLTLNIDSQQAFVAMWFDSEMDGVFEQAIAPAIKDVGYRPVIINQKQHNNHIVEEIIAEIRRSKFVIADFTCGTYETTEKDETGKQVSKELPRGGVYFEAGFAKGLGREVIWTVRFDKLKYVHFDTAQYNFIVWDSLEDLRKKLAIRIAATIGDGPLRKLN